MRVIWSSRIEIEATCIWSSTGQSSNSRTTRRGDEEKEAYVSFVFMLTFQSGQIVTLTLRLQACELQDGRQEQQPWWNR